MAGINVQLNVQINFQMAPKAGLKRVGSRKGGEWRFEATEK